MKELLIVKLKNNYENQRQNSFYRFDAKKVFVKSVLKNQTKTCHK